MVFAKKKSGRKNAENHKIRGAHLGLENRPNENGKVPLNELAVDALLVAEATVNLRQSPPPIPLYHQTLEWAAWGLNSRRLRRFASLSLSSLFQLSVSVPLYSRKLKRKTNFLRLCVHRTPLVRRRCITLWRTRTLPHGMHFSQSTSTQIYKLPHSGVGFYALGAGLLWLHLEVVNGFPPLFHQ